MVLTILSAVLSTVSLFVCWWLGIFGVILGISAMCNKNKREEQRGAINALPAIGIALGGGSILICLFCMCVIAIL